MFEGGGEKSRHYASQDRNTNSVPPPANAHTHTHTPAHTTARASCRVLACLMFVARARASARPASLSVGCLRSLPDPHPDHTSKIRLPYRYTHCSNTGRRRLLPTSPSPIRGMQIVLQIYRLRRLWGVRCCPIIVWFVFQPTLSATGMPSASSDVYMSKIYRSSNTLLGLPVQIYTRRVDKKQDSLLRQNRGLVTMCPSMDRSASFDCTGPCTRAGSYIHLYNPETRILPLNRALHPYEGQTLTCTCTLEVPTCARAI